MIHLRWPRSRKQDRQERPPPWPRPDQDFSDHEQREDLETIIRLDPVEWVGLQEGSILVDLGPIEPYGRYRLEIYAGGFPCRIHNERPISVGGISWDHPLVLEGEIKCWGNLGLFYYQGHSPMLVLALIEFLRQGFVRLNGNYASICDEVHQEFIKRTANGR